MTTIDYIALVAAIIVVVSVGFFIFNIAQNAKTAAAFVQDPNQRNYSGKFKFTLVSLLLGLAAMFIFGG